MQGQQIMSCNVLHEIEKTILTETRSYYKIKADFMFTNMTMIDYLKSAQRFKNDEIVRCHKYLSWDKMDDKVVLVF